MDIRQQRGKRIYRGIIGVTLLVITGSIAIYAAPALAQSNPASSSNSANAHTHMPESIRSSIGKVVVIGSPGPTNRDITGSYEQDTPGLIGGMDEGSRAATISKDIGSVPINVPIPILTIPAAIYGGLSGATKRELQEFRDELTDELAKAGSLQLANDGLALDVFRGLQKLPKLDSKLFAPTTPIPADTDAILYVNINGVTIDVQGKEAILTASVGATLRRLDDGKALYEKVVEYQDRDTLDNWTENENALWHDFANFARHYLGREISAEVFDRVALRHELRPKESDTVTRVKKNDWQGVSRSMTPTLAWELTLLGGHSYGTWAAAIEASDIFYDVEIYDRHQLVYAEKQVPNSFHTVAYEIEACGSYRWSVRPSYHIGGDVKYGEWMRFESDSGMEPATGSVGRKASEAPAYIQDFATLEIECGRK